MRRVFLVLAIVVFIFAAFSFSPFGSLNLVPLGLAFLAGSQV